jgi:hypothetical protein
MNASLLLVVLVAAAVFAALIAWRAAGARRIALFAVHALAFAALYLFLFPPPGATAARALAVLTPGNGDGAIDRTTTVVALPGAAAPAGVERVPDLATALRRHADTQRLVIVGDGLPARDLDAAKGLGVAFDAPAEPRGIVELDTSAQVRSGGTWRVAGRVAGVPGGRVELRDPAGAIVASVAPGADGRYALAAQAKRAGRYRFELRALDADGAAVDTASLPLAVDAGDAPRLRLVAGGPDPDVKYLRRWAADAGVALTSRIALSTDLALRQGDATLDAASLADTDLVVVDERAWASLAAAEKTALTAAVDDGLGLLLRVTGPLDAAVAADWAAYGFAIAPADVAQTVRLSSDEASPALTRTPVTVTAHDAIALVADPAGAPLASWRTHGRGRVGVWPLVDSYRLALAGYAARYGALWAATTGTLARARGAVRAALPATARIGERAVICGLPDAAEVESPQGRRVALASQRDASDRCAAFWPAAAGWHRLVAGDATQDFFVRANDDARTLARAQTIAATRALVGGAGGDGGAPTKGSRWPFFFAWLVLAGVAWRLEKRRA